MTAVGMVLALAALGVALALRPWRMLTAGLLTPWLATIVFLPLLWLLPQGLPNGMAVQFSGACLLVLMVGWPLAVLALAVVAALVWALGALPLAPVLSQPSLPFAFGAKRLVDLNLSPADVQRVAQRASEGCQVLGLRYKGDRLVGTRFAELHKLLGDAFIAVEFDSTTKSDHSVLTEQRQELGVQRVLDFLKLKLL